jgi:hypothetical protein
MSRTLELSPSPCSISLLKIRQIADAGPNGDDLDLFNLANDLKFHSSPVPLTTSSKCSSTDADYSCCRLWLRTFIRGR